MRLIDVDAFKIEFCEKCNNVSCDAPLTNTDCFTMYMLDNTPTIEAEPVRHGRWVPLSYDGYVVGYPVYDEWECSECHFACEGEGEPPLNYCPNCGAKMEGKNEDGVD